MFCIVPHEGLTIDPDGAISICCASNNRYPLGHISTHDLQDVYNNNEIMKQLRLDNMEYYNKYCISCVNREKRNTTSRRQKMLVNRKPLTRDDKIRFLEFTTSNICNQFCSSCSSYYSSKWAQYDQDILDFGIDFRNLNSRGFDSIGYMPYRLSDEDIRKIMNTLPHLEELFIKGGEPFADQNNFKILEELNRVNPNCTVQLVTNLSKVPDNFLRILKEHKGKIHVTVSIDGIDELYEWIRSTKFDQTLNNIFLIKKELNPGISCTITGSIFNIFNIADIINFFTPIARIKVHQTAITPEHISPYYVFNEDQLWHALEKYYKNVKYENDTFIKNFNPSLDLEVSPIIKNNARKWISYMNHVRGFNIQDLVPELKDILWKE